jgi:hypothetical protein
VEVCESKEWRSAALLHEGSARGVALLAADGDPLALLPRRLPPPSDDALLRYLASRPYHPHTLIPSDLPAIGLPPITCAVFLIAKPLR